MVYSSEYDLGGHACQVGIMREADSISNPKNTT